MTSIFDRRPRVQNVGVGVAYGLSTLATIRRLSPKTVTVAEIGDYIYLQCGQGFTRQQIILTSFSHSDPPPSL